MHEQALLRQIAPEESSPSARLQMLKMAGSFFAEAITPLEEGHRVALESNGQLSRMNKALKQRTLALAVSNRQLKREVARRKVVEKHLRESEQQSLVLLTQSQLLQEQLRGLSRRILLVQEDERKRISRELHDVVAQLLTGINMRLANLKTEAQANTKGIDRKISNTQRLVEKSVNVVHKFALELRPAILDDLGLAPALHSLLKKFTKETGVWSSLAVSKGIDKLGNAECTVFYRVAQEALSNVSQHAQANRVEVVVERHQTFVRMRIHDDGKAFDVEHARLSRKRQRLGLIGMRERMEMVGGTFIIESKSGQGTAIIAQVPLACRKKEHECK
ncbi:MAG: sensor histidine kinase [Kiritimatiellae bacterium]|nr:sensor histidine kinase [Kiritimatiellia bacterium]